MSNNKQGFNERLARKKRVQRMKTGLILFILTWMLGWMLVSISLIAKVHSLQEQIDILTENTIRSQPIGRQENQTPNSDQVKMVSSFHTKDESNSRETGKDLSTGDSSEKETSSEQDTKENEKKVYLTFDDGPSANTRKILDILDQYQIHATFFVTGKDDEESLKLYKEIVDRGNAIGMHSFSHKYDELYSSLESFEEDFKKIQSRIQEATGRECKLYRFPGGSSNQVSNLGMETFIQFLNQEEVTYFDWNVECGDATSNNYTTDEMVANVMKDVVKFNTSVVLMHDAENKPNTVAALPVIIKKLQKMDVQLLPIDENTRLVQHVAADSVKN